MLERLLCGSGYAKRGHSQNFSAVARVFIPAVRRGSLYAHSCFHVLRDNARFIRFGLFFKLLDTRHGYNARVHALFLKNRFRLHAKLYFRTRRNQEHVRFSVAIFQNVTALEGVFAAVFILRQRLAGKHERGRLAALERGYPRSRRFLAVRGTIYFHAGDRAEHKEMFHGLMGRAVLAHADRVVR